MLVVKHDSCHWLAMIVAFEDAEWSIWPNAAATAMAVAHRFPGEFPGPTGRQVEATRLVSCVAGHGPQYTNRRFCSMLCRVDGIQPYNPPLFS